MRSGLSVERKSGVLMGDSLRAGEGPLSRWHQELRERAPMMYWSGWVCVLYASVFLCLMPLDPHLILGINPWLKPLKFAISAWVYLWTIGWLLSELRLGRVVSWLLRWSFALVMWVELACIGIQSWRGTTSHFNDGSLFDATVFSVMAGAIMWNTLLVFVVGLCFFFSSRWREGLSLKHSYLWGIRWGIAIFLLGSLQGFVMVSAKAHTIGHADGGPGLPFLNWSTIAGDLRIAHFIGLHALQLLPLLGAWLASRSARWVHGVSAVYLLWVAGIFVQAMMGLPLLAM